MAANAQYQTYHLYGRQRPYSVVAKLKVKCYSPTPRVSTDAFEHTVANEGHCSLSEYMSSMAADKSLGPQNGSQLLLLYPLNISVSSMPHLE